jgi:MFS family permease
VRGGSRQPAGWRLLLLHCILVQGVAAVVRPTASYRAIELGVPVAWLGVLSASFALAPLVVAFSVGRAVDRRGERPVLLAGGVLVLVAAAGFTLVATSLPWLMAWSVVLGLGHLLGVVGGQSVAAGMLSPRDVDRGFGVYTFAASAGQALGPGVIAVLGGGRALPDASPILLAALLASALLLGATLVLARRTRSLRGRRGAGRGGALREALAVPGLPRAVLVSLVVLSAVDLIGVYLPALGAERGLTAGWVGALLAARAVASMASRFFLGALVLRWGRTTVLVAGTVAAAAATAGLALPMPGWLLCAVVLVAGLGLGVGQPLTLSWVVQAAPQRIRGTALSLRISGNRLGQTVLPAGLGLVAATAGAGGVFVATGGVLAVAAAVSAPRGGAAQP